MRRLRSVGNQLRERIERVVLRPRAARIELRLAVGNDFADLFEIKDVVRDRSTEITREHAPTGRS